MNFKFRNIDLEFISYIYIVFMKNKKVLLCYRKRRNARGVVSLAQLSGGYPCPIQGVPLSCLGVPPSYRGWGTPGRT